MFGRRSHARFAITTPAEGSLRILRDVLLQRVEGDELVAISRQAGVVGETLKIEVTESDRGPHKDAMNVRVFESRPIVIDGTVRHRLRLELVDGPRPDEFDKGAG